MTAIRDTECPVMDEYEELTAHDQGQQYRNTIRRYPLENHTRQEAVQSTPRFCESRNWGCTTYLTLSVGFIHILASTYIVTHSSDNVAIFFSILAITVNILLCYGAIFSRKETLIVWLAFYGIIAFVAMSCLTPKNIKVKKKNMNIKCLLIIT